MIYEGVETPYKVSNTGVVLKKNGIGIMAI